MLGTIEIDYEAIESGYFNQKNNIQYIGQSNSNESDIFFCYKKLFSAVLFQLKEDLTSLKNTRPEIIQHINNLDLESDRFNFICNFLFPAYCDKIKKHFTKLLNERKKEIKNINKNRKQFIIKDVVFSKKIERNQKIIYIYKDSILIKYGYIKDICSFLNKSTKTIYHYLNNKYKSPDGYIFKYGNE